MNEGMNPYQAFEEAVAEVFKKAGYIVEAEDRRGGRSIDLVAKIEEQGYAIEIKYYTNDIEHPGIQIERAIQQTVQNVEALGLIPVLIVSVVISKETKAYYQKTHPDLIILDVANLLYVVKNDPRIYDLVVSSLPRAIEGIEPEEPDAGLNLKWLEHQDSCQSIITQLEKCTTGKTYATAFEKACTAALRYIFAEDLLLWKTQKTSNAGLFRFDLICRIKDDIHKTFWRTLEQFFQTKYIVFEFKNHRKKIGQAEIYTTEKYLYPKALRSVGIIIAANGIDKHADQAIKGIFRETGKLILVFSKSDLINMCKIRNNEDDPSNYLMDKLDYLLTTLEK